MEHQNMDTAVTFLREVKRAAPAEFDQLVNILSQYRSNEVEAESVVTTVAAMLEGRAYLLEGFGKFLPPICREKLLESLSPKLGKRPQGESKHVATGSPPSPKRSRVHEVATLGGVRPLTQMQQYRAQLKEELRPVGLSESWPRLLERLEAAVSEIISDPEGSIPSIDFKDIAAGSVSEASMAKLRRAGVLRIRGVVPRGEAEGMNEQIMDDFRHLLGVDPENPKTYEQKIYGDQNPKAFTLGGVQEMYYSRAQFEARQHPNMHAVKKWLNGVWTNTDRKTGEPVCVPELDLTYVDRWRHRLPGFEVQTGMKEHLDNGGMCRWADPAWKDVYGPLMEGRLDDYDPWHVGSRVNTSAQFFRSFQGWLALTEQGPGDGTLEVVPLLAESMAYLLMRPFAGDVPAHQFCGVTDTGGSETLEITCKWHAALLRGKVSVGRVEPGDTVWWHPDIVHGVEERHGGGGASNVVYVAAAPMCPQNAGYLRKQREAFQKGCAPPDFPDIGVERGSDRMMGEEVLTELGRRQMGLAPWVQSDLGRDAGGGGGGLFQGKVGILDACNKILFEGEPGNGGG